MREDLMSFATGDGGIAARRWTQLVLGVLCMILIANFQYGWTLFVHPIAVAHHWSVAGIQVAFSIFVALETWLTPVGGWIVDSLGPKRGPTVVVAAGGVLVAVAWIVNAIAGSLGTLYLGAALSGIGAGAVYSSCVGNAVRWFADRRGLAVGITTAGFGAGAALTVIPIRLVIATAGYASAFFWFGLGQGTLIFILAWWLRGPLPGEVPTVVANARLQQSARSYRPTEMLATPVFWVLYLMFMIVAASGLMATAQIALIAHSYRVADMTILLGASTLTITLVVDNIMNGLARPLFGSLSDRIGRENTMAIAFSIGGISYWLLGVFGSSPWSFVLFAGLIFITWGEIFSLFPSVCTDSFGPIFATTNLSLLYTAKGIASFLVPLANVLKAATGNWHTVFVITAIGNFVVVALALFVLKPIRLRHQAAVAEYAGLRHV
jgi:MFS transporter, OFA family, oxalate/formate antiporter